MGAIHDLDAPRFLERHRIPDPNLRAPIAHVDLFAVIGHAPAFTWITEASQYAKTRLVVDEAGLRLPCELQNLLIENRDAFAKKRLRHVEILHNPAGVEIDLPQRRAADQTGSLVEKPIAILETLGECRPVVRINLHHPKAVFCSRQQKSRKRKPEAEEA